MQQACPLSPLLTLSRVLLPRYSATFGTRAEHLQPVRCHAKAGLRLGPCHDVIEMAAVEFDGAAAALADDVMTVVAMLR